MVLKKRESFKYFYLVGFAIVAYLSFLIIKPFISAILASLVLAYIFYPVHKWLVKYVKSPTVSAVLISLVLILVLFLPVFLFADDLFMEARVGYLVVKQKLATGNVFGISCPEQVKSFACSVSRPIQAALANPEINVYLQEAASKATTFLLSSVSNFLLSLPRLILNLLVTFFVTFYLFIDGHKILVKSRSLLPMARKHQEHIIRKLKDVTFAVVYGSIIIAVIQGIFGAIGFWIFGLGQPLLWGAVMAVVALVPFIGTAIVWLPASLFLIIVGSANGDSAMLGRGIGLLIWGALLVGSLDNILKPKIIGSRAGIHPVIVLIGAIGGLALMGFVGFIIGPLILALFKTLIDIYEKEELRGK